MGQKITIRILNRQHPLTAESPEEEKMFRDAAEKVDEKFYEYAGEYPNQGVDEILSFVAFNAFVEISRLETEIRRKEKEAADIQTRLRSYLKNIDTQE